jgi:hypothetical protein
MKNIRLSVAALLAPALLVPSLGAENAISADSFVDSIGVTIHMSYTNTPYASEWPQVFAALKASGIRHYRDGFYPWDPAKVPYYRNHQQLGAAGIRGDIIVPWNPKTTADQVVQFCRLATDCEVLEDPNEINASHMPNWVDRLKSMLPIIDQAAGELHIPVYGPSLTRAEAYPEVGDIGSTMTFNNLHIYFGGRHPGSHGWGPKGYGSIDYWKNLAEITGPGKPSVVTESGYMTSDSKPYDVPEDFQSAYLLRTLMEMHNAGIVRTYIYEFLDEVSSPDYGILHADLTPKPAYTALKNLIGVLDDKGPRFTPGALDYSLEGASPDVHHLLMQKRDGTFYLALWIEQPGYDTAKAMRTPIAPRPTSLHLSGGAAGKSILQIDDKGAMTSKPLARGASIPLNLTGKMTLVEISGPSAAGR